MPGLMTSCMYQVKSCTLLILSLEFLFTVKFQFDTTELQELAELCVAHIISHLPAGSQRLDSYTKAQSKDSVCQQIIDYCHTGWPELKVLNPSYKHYWELRSELTFCDGLLMRDKELLYQNHYRKRSYTSFMEHTKVSHVATPEQRFLYGGLASHSNSKSTFKIVHHVPEITDLTKSHS